MWRLWASALLLCTGGCLAVPAEEIQTGSEDLNMPDAFHASTSDSREVEPPPVVLQWNFILPSASIWDLPEPETAAVLPPFLLEDPEAIEERQVLEGEQQTPPEDEGETVAIAAEPEKVTFDFPVVENDKVRYFIDYYTGRGRKVFERWLERSGRYLPMMRQIFREEGLPLDLTYLALVESGFNPRAYSWAHAAGPWQFIPSTGRMFGLENDWWRDERRDFEKSTRAAARFLKDLHRRFDGDWYLAVAGYNAGGGKIRRAIRRYKTRDFWEICHGSYLQTETKNYVPKLLATILIAKEPQKYGFADLQYQDPLDYETVILPTATDLEIVADLCGVSYEEVKNLNPELKRWCTPPGEKNYRARIPAGTREAFTEKYAAISERDRANYLRHQVRKGDTLLALAQRYRIRVDDIVALNGIRNPRALRIGSDLILPLSKNYNKGPLKELSDDYNRSRRRTYTVRKGDSLWKIARRFDVSEKQLRVWNRLGWSNVIRPGQRLVVSSSAAPSRTRTVQAKGQRKIVYHVRPGDTLWAIGRQFEVPTREIMNWNQLDDDHILRPGDKLTLLIGSGGRG